MMTTVAPSTFAAASLALALELEVARLEVGPLGLELLLVRLGRAQRLAARQQEIAGEAVLDFDGFAHVAELGDAFEQNDFHDVSPFSAMFGLGVGRTAARTRSRVNASATPRSARTGRMYCAAKRQQA